MIPDRDGWLSLPEALRLVEAIGIPVAKWSMDLAEVPGERVVVKDVHALHKTEVGGVKILPRSEAGPGLVMEYVPHELELLLGGRRAPDLGPIVLLAPGGTDAEATAAAMRPGAGLIVRAPGLSALDLEETAIGRSLVAPGRNRPPRVGREEIERVMAAFAAALERWPRIAELEVNPLVVVDGRLVALDARARLAEPRPERTPSAEAIPAMLRPRTVAVEGVSTRMNPGRIILRNLLADGFDAARLRVVKPGLDQIDGVRCVPHVGELDVDLLVLAVDAAQAAEVVHDAVGHARGIVLIPGGLGETPGSEGRAEAVRAALGAGTGLVGGNCLGIRSRPGRVDTFFLPRDRLPPGPVPAPMALLSQSGAFAAARLTRWAPLDPRYVITVGNQLDLTLGAWMEHFAADPELRVVATYAEGFRSGDGRRWLRGAEQAIAKGKTVLLYRGARSPAGQKAGASHTAAVAGDWPALRELARGIGVRVADDIDAFDDLVRVAVAGRRTRGRRVGVMSNAGFECVAAADGLGRLELARLAAPERLAERLRFAKLDGIVPVAQPLDLTPMADDATFADCAALLLEDEGVDLAVIGCVPLTAALAAMGDVTRPDGVAARLGALWGRSRKPWVLAVDAGPAYDPFVAALEAHGIPVLRGMDRAIAAIAGMVG